MREKEWCQFIFRGRKNGVSSFLGSVGSGDTIHDYFQAVAPSSGSFPGPEKEWCQFIFRFRRFRGHHT